MKILLAEDDPNISTIAKMTLETLGKHKVAVASDGEVALQKALSENFDLILLDEMMPKMNGLMVCQEYRKRAGDKASPVIFLSAKSQHTDIEEFQQFGLGFIAKPFDPKTLCPMIDKIMARTKSRAA